MKNQLIRSFELPCIKRNKAVDEYENWSELFWFLILSYENFQMRRFVWSQVILIWRSLFSFRMKHVNLLLFLIFLYWKNGSVADEFPLSK